MATINYKNATIIYQAPPPGGAASLRFSEVSPSPSPVPSPVPDVYTVCFGQDAGEFTISVVTASFSPSFAEPGFPRVGKLYIDGTLVADGVEYTWTVVDGASVEWTDVTTCHITTNGGGGSMLDVTYNSTKIIDSLEVTPPVTVTYNGNTIATLNDGDTKTLSCNGKVMSSNVVIGNKTLQCSGKLMASDIAIEVGG